MTTPPDAQITSPIVLIILCAVIRHRFPVGASPIRPSLIAPAGSHRSGGGGNEAVGAFETHVPPGGAASRQAVMRVNTEQASKDFTWEPTRQYIGEGRRRW
jgi:hypothetical protein